MIRAVFINTHLSSTFLYAGIGPVYIFTTGSGYGDPLIFEDLLISALVESMSIRDIERKKPQAGGWCEMTIAPLRHLGHKCGSMPVVAVIKSRVFLYFFTSGGHTFKCLRIDFKLRALNLCARNPICLILTNRFGSICSANSFRNLTPTMVLHFS